MITFIIDTTKLAPEGIGFRGFYTIDQGRYEATGSDTSQDMADVLAEKMAVEEDEDELMDDIEEACQTMVASQSVFSITLDDDSYIHLQTVYDK